MISWRLYLIHLIFGWLPPTRCFRIKAALLRWAGARVGSNVRIASSARFLLSGELSIGCDVWIGHDVLIVGGIAPIVIGNQVDIAPRVTLVTGSHEIAPYPARAAGTGISSPITIGDGTWICAGSTILGGAVLETGCVVAAGALVRDSFSAGSIVAGVPARRIRNRCDSGQS